MFFEPIPLRNYEQIAIHCDKVTLSVKDITLILSKTWFNDRIIDSYCTLFSGHLIINFLYTIVFGLLTNFVVLTKILTCQR